MIIKKDLKLMMANHIEKDINGENLTFGEKFADKMSVILGSYSYLICLNIFIVLYVILQYIIPFDVTLLYLNFVLSYLAAIGTPMLQMSSNRQSIKDRHHMEVDLNVNIETKKLLEEMDKKIDKQQQIINNLIKETKLLKNK
jgi:uncharacterized membrane protein